MYHGILLINKCTATIRINLFIGLLIYKTSLHRWHQLTQASPEAGISCGGNLTEYFTGI